MKLARYNLERTHLYNKLLKGHWSHNLLARDLYVYKIPPGQVVEDKLKGFF
jgi:hypothetical protein